MGFVLELFHVFPVELFLLLAYGDKMVTHDDSDPEKCPSSPQNGQNPPARLRAAGQGPEQSVTDRTNPVHPSLCLSALPGGLAAVIYTDALQTLIMLVGAVSLMAFSECFPGGLSLKL